MKKRVFALLTILLLVISSVPVMAAKTPSPTAKEYYSISINGNTSSKKGSVTVEVPGGKITSSTGVVEIGKSVTLKATANKGMIFQKWVISGDYTIVSGTLKDDTITIIPNGDIDVDAKFVSENPTETETKTPGETTAPPDNSNTSPKTGFPTPIAIMIVLVLAGGMIVFSRKKITE